MKLLTVEDLAKRWRCSTSRINQLSKDKLPPRFELPGSRNRLWREDVVEAWEKALPGGSPAQVPDSQDMAALTDVSARRAGRGRPAKLALRDPTSRSKPPDEEELPTAAGTL